MDIEAMSQIGGEGRGPSTRPAVCNVRRQAHRARLWKSTLKAYAYPIIGNMDLRDIDTGLVMQIVQPIWTIKTETASRVRGRIESILDWGKVQGYREGENPARWSRRLENLLPERGGLHAPAATRPSAPSRNSIGFIATKIFTRRSR